MKHAKIYSKNDMGQTIYEGEAVLLNEMEHAHTRVFWEYRFIEGGLTHCGWIDNDKIFEA